MRQSGEDWAAEVADECESVEDEPGARSWTLGEVSPELRRALEQAQPGPTGMRTVRAMGAGGKRYVAGLYEGSIYLLELPWPNPNGECRKLPEEPRGVDWQPHR